MRTNTNLNADRLDDREASSFADGVGGKATNAELLDGQDSSAFLRANQKVSDSDRLDGKDSAEFYASGSKVADSNQLDGVDSTGFIQGKGNMYRAKRTLGFVIDGRELILNVPGFGRRGAARSAKRRESMSSRSSGSMVRTRSSYGG